MDGHNEDQHLGSSRDGVAAIEGVKMETDEMDDKVLPEDVALFDLWEHDSQASRINGLVEAGNVQDAFNYMLDLISQLLERTNDMSKSISSLRRSETNLKMENDQLRSQISLLAKHFTGLKKECRRGVECSNEIAAKLIEHTSVISQSMLNPSAATFLAAENLVFQTLRDAVALLLPTQDAVFNYTSRFGTSLMEVLNTRGLEVPFGRRDFVLLVSDIDFAHCQYPANFNDAALNRYKLLTKYDETTDMGRLLLPVMPFLFSGFLNALQHFTIALQGLRGGMNKSNRHPMSWQEFDAHWKTPDSLVEEFGSLYSRGSYNRHREALHSNFRKLSMFRPAVAILLSVEGVALCVNGSVERQPSNSDDAQADSTLDAGEIYSLVQSLLSDNSADKMRDSLLGLAHGAPELLCKDDAP